MFNMGMWDWTIVFMIVLLLFGGKRIPELAKGIGKSLSSFRQGLKEAESELEKGPDEKHS